MKLGTSERTPKSARLWIGLSICLLLSCIGVVLLYPTKTVIVPAWKLRVVDESGKPYTEQFVRQSWKHYSFELDAGEDMEDQWTDADGYVAFPERVIRANLVQRMLNPLTNKMSLGEHASYGASAAVTTWNSEGSESVSVEYDPNKPLPKEIVLPR